MTTAPVMWQPRPTAKPAKRAGTVPRATQNPRTGRVHKQTQQAYRNGTNSAAATINSGSSSSSKDGKQRTVGHYMLGKALGEGSFGKVRLATHIMTGEKVAVKVLEKSRLVESADVQRVAREIKILKRNRHKNIVQLFEVLDTPNAIYLIMENCDGGEMFNHIVQRKRLDEASAAGFFAQIIDGAEYLHAMEVTHRDLKPENLLLQSTAMRGLLVKIVDFGLSNTHDGGAFLGTACGSPCYAAPEMIAGKKYWGPKADIWSMGVILYASVAGYLPFEDQNTSVLYKKIMAGDYSCPNWISRECVDLIGRILNTDPDRRSTIPQIRDHPWYLKHEPSFKHVVPGDVDDVVEAASSLAADAAETTTKAVALDEGILRQVEHIGIDPDLVRAAFAAGAHNNTTATYQLLKNRRIRIDDSANAPPPKAVSPLDQRHYKNPLVVGANQDRRPTTTTAASTRLPSGSSAALPIAFHNKNHANKIPKLELGGTSMLPDSSTARPGTTGAATSSGRSSKNNTTAAQFYAQSQTARQAASSSSSGAGGGGTMQLPATARAADGGQLNPILPRRPSATGSSVSSRGGRRPLFTNNNNINNSNSNSNNNAPRRQPADGASSADPTRPSSSYRDAKNRPIPVARQPLALSTTTTIGGQPPSLTVASPTKTSHHPTPIQPTRPDSRANRRPAPAQQRQLNQLTAQQ